MDLDTSARVDVAGSILGTSLAKVDLSVLTTDSGTIKPSSSATSVEKSPVKETVKAVVLNGSSNAPAVERRCALFGYGSSWKPWQEKFQLFGPDCRATACDVDSAFVPFVISSCLSPVSRKGKEFPLISHAGGVTSISAIDDSDDLLQNGAGMLNEDVTLLGDADDVRTEDNDVADVFAGDGVIEFVELVCGVC